MLSSYQISQIMAQQQSMFAGAQSYSQQISAGMPGPYMGGLGARGFGGGGAQFPQTPYGSNQTQGFSYGGGMGGYGPGNSFGNSAVSSMGGLASAGVSMATSPLSWGMGGFAAARGMGMGIGGSLGMGALAGGAAMGIGALGHHFIGSAIGGAQEQSGVERVLSQFQFQNAGSRTGRGFTRSDSMGIGNMMRSMERMPEMLTSMSELTRIMDKMGQMGLMNGIRDAGEFSKKFRDTIDSLKTISKMMGTTMEDAMASFGEARRSGFYTSSDIMKNVMNRQITSSLTGMNQGQIGALQQYGADMGHATGGSRRSGAQAITRIAGQFGMLNQMGKLSNDQIMEMTGKEGAEGIQDLSAGMAQLSHRMSKGNVGTVLSAALAEKDSSGNFTGGMNEELVDRVRSGEVGLSELRKLARQNLRGRNAKMSYVAHRGRLRSEMANAVGAEGIAMQLQSILGSRGWKNPNATNIVMQRFGASEEQANLLQQVMPDLQTATMQMGISGQESTRQSARQAALKQDYGWDSIKRRIGKKIAHYTTDWAKDIGVGVRDYFQNWADDFMDEVTGQYRTKVTQRVADLFRGSMAGEGGARSQLQSIMGERGMGRGGDLRGGGGIIGSGIRWLSGTTTAGEKMASQLSRWGSGSRVSYGSTDALRDQGNTILMGSMGVSLSTSREDISAVIKGYSDFESGSEGGAALSKIKSALGSDYGTLVGAAASAMGNMGVARMDVNSRARAILSNMSKTNSAAYKKAVAAAGSEDKLLLSIQRDEKLQGLAGMTKAKDLADMLQGVGLGNLADMAKNRESLQKSISKMNFGAASGGMSSGEVISLLDTGGAKAEFFEKLLDTSDASKARGAISSIGDAVRVGSAAYMAGAKGSSIWDVGTGALVTTDIQQIVGKPGPLTESDKRTLESKGFTTNQINALAGDPKLRQQMVRAAQMAGGLGGQKLKDYLKASLGEGVLVELDRMSKRGSAVLAAMTGHSVTLGDIRKKGGAGARALGILEEEAGTWASGDAGKMLGHTSRWGDMAAELAGADPKQREQLLKLARDQGLGEVLQADMAYQNVMKKGKHLGRGKSLSQLGINQKDFGDSDEALGLYKGLEALTSADGKAGVQSKKELDLLAKAMSSDAVSKNLAKAGTDQGSKYMNEQEVANTFKAMSENNKTTAQILANIAAGKSPGEGTGTTSTTTEKKAS